MHSEFTEAPWNILIKKSQRPVILIICVTSSSLFCALDHLQLSLSYNLAKLNSHSNSTVIKKKKMKLLHKNPYGTSKESGGVQSDFKV